MEKPILYSLESGVSRQDLKLRLDVARHYKYDKLKSRNLMTAQQEKIRKPMNSFFLYKQHMRAKVIKKNGKLRGSELSKIITTMWKNESSEVKNHFQNLSKKEYDNHKKLYPDFVWPTRVTKNQKSKILNIKTNKNWVQLPVFDFNNFSTGWTPATNDEIFTKYFKQVDEAL
ncbi:high mobility group box domain-containing protein [Globomyces pollinis-pini]|nr:high mobility group box domain-containing protein [Globomyces pollinis-pini]